MKCTRCIISHIYLRDKPGVSLIRFLSRIARLCGCFTDTSTALSLIYTEGAQPYERS